MKLFSKLFDWNDPEVRGRYLKTFWVISLFMLVLGYILIVYFLFMGE
ncbi:hypothetical protein [Candidatus Methanomassiliicoccus intestinalis]